MTRISVAKLPSLRSDKDDRNGPKHVHLEGESVTRENPSTTHHSLMPQFIQRLEQDLSDISRFYDFSISSRRSNRIKTTLDAASSELESFPFDDLDQSGKVDYLLTKSFIRRQLQQLDFEREKTKSMEALLDVWTASVEEFCLERQEVRDIQWRQTADKLSESAAAARKVADSISQKQLNWSGSPSLAARATRVIDELEDRLDEAFKFYKGYHPLATWWLEQPCMALANELDKLKSIVKERLVGIKPGDKDAIIGDPIGRDALLADIRSEFVAYSPEELIEIGNNEYEWCEVEMKRASAELGYGEDWRKALEHVKNMYPGPGEQPVVVQKLAKAAVDYVRKADLVTVPAICEETRRTFMMSPQRQKANPFFLGGTNLIISYPTNEMDHESKMMSMRGNSVPFSKATVFHELIPGHHLQYHYISRYNTYRRKIFDTPFWMEGWALYWEFLFWERGDFFTTPEERIGTLFWRMHRCARIVFSIKFHLGQMTPQQCVDYLVEKVGHERATAEGEVRRSFSGDYRPLYQAGYMLGALQLRQLRHELVDSGKVCEKDFHDQILRANEMPIDMLRALLTGMKLTADHEATWKFYNKHWHTI